MKIPVVVQHRHIHVSEQDAKILFQTSELEMSTQIDQHNQFVATQTVSVIGPKGSFQQVCVIGPVRSHTQVELSSSDAFSLGLNAPLRVSGDIERSASVVLKTELGEVQAKSCAIVPIRHLHLPPALADELVLAHHDVVTLRMMDREQITFDHVIVRVHPTFIPAFHLTKDEAAPQWIQTGDFVLL
ncbi:propanediol utilization protein [Candidatus Uhrbacteria bacterium]|nr:propanediol utilization protein [Candidatus Uhrbacteria bacterium]